MTKSDCNLELAWREFLAIRVIIAHRGLHSPNYT